MIKFKHFIQGIAILGITIVWFVGWYLAGRNASLRCPQIPAAIPSARRQLPAVPDNSSVLQPYRFDMLLSTQLMKYKEDRLLNIRYPTWSLLLQPQTAGKPANPLACSHIVHPFMSFKRKYSCLAVMFAGTDNSYNLLRHEDLTTPKDQLPKDQPQPEDEPDGDSSNSTGFFGHVANDKGRMLLGSKMSRLLTHLPDLKASLLAQLAGHGLKPGDQVIVLVLNDGEMDMYANFLCSLRRHGLLHLQRRIVVFTSSADSLPLLRAMGSIAVHHEAFPLASRHASYEYLDPIFIEMMWYKSFSVWLLLHMGYQALFMDVDIIFFKDPFVYFQLADNSSQVDAFLTDDGQRSLRYAPFYANSGFYFLRTNSKTIYFTWSIMTAFALLHITGSHQNIFTLRLLEGLDFYYLRTSMLPMRAFPSGVKFSHDRPYMQAIADGHETPVIFHMCWTKNKEHKLVNFKLSKMWYVEQEAGNFLNALGMVEGPRDKGQLRPPAYDEANQWNRLAKQMEAGQVELEDRWRRLAPLVCTDHGGS